MSKTAMKLALDALGEIEWSNNSQWQSDRAKVAITALRDALAEQPAPPPECKTEAEKTAYAFGWFKALESVREKPAQQEGVMVGGWGREATKKQNARKQRKDGAA